MSDGVTNWSRFWWGMSALAAGVFVFFALSYRGQARRNDTGRLNA